MDRKNHLLQIRVCAAEKKQIEAIAEMMGFSSVSDYVRSRVLENSLLILKKLDELNDNVRQISKKIER